jgi:hypothetical protein
MAKPTYIKGRKLFSFGTLVKAPDVAMALGELTAAWSFLELQLTDLLEKATGLSYENASAIMSAVNATSARIDIVRTVIERRKPDDEFRIAAVAALRKVSALCGRRNALVHHAWGYAIDEKKAYTLDFRAEPATQGRRTVRTAKGIATFRAEVIAVCRIVMALHDRLYLAESAARSTSNTVLSDKRSVPG